MSFWKRYKKQDYTWRELSFLRYEDGERSEYYVFYQLTDDSRIVIRNKFHNLIDLLEFMYYTPHGRRSYHNFTSLEERAMEVLYRASLFKPDG